MTDRGDGYDEIRKAFQAGVAQTVAAIAAKHEGRNARMPDAERYVERLKVRPVVAKLFADEA